MTAAPSCWTTLLSAGDTVLSPLGERHRPGHLGGGGGIAEVEVVITEEMKDTLLLFRRNRIRGSRNRSSRFNCQ